MQKSVHSIIYNVLSLEFNDDETRERGNAVRCKKVLIEPHNVDMSWLMSKTKKP